MKLKLGVLLVLLTAVAASHVHAGGGIKAGAAKVDITPPLPAPYDLLQTATEVAHPLHARVLYLEDEDDQAVIVALDYEGLLRTAYDRLRDAIAQATGVPRERIVVNCNHSHNAPWVNLDVVELLAPHGIRQVDRKHFEGAVTAIAGAARRAKQGMKAVTLSVGAARLPELAWNRRNGYVVPADVERFNKKRKYPVGVSDPTVGLVRIDGEGGKPVAVVSIYASHYMSAGGGRISSSYPGPAMDAIEKELGQGCVALFLQGCAGNIAPHPDVPNGSKDAVERAGAMLAGRALSVLKEKMKPIEGGGFTFASRKVEIPLKPLREHGSMDFVRSMFSRPAVNASAKHPPLALEGLERKFGEALELYKRHKDDKSSYSYILNLMAYGDRLTLARNLKAWSLYDFQALRAGPLCLVFLPGESFIEFALEIRDHAGCEHTFVAAYNDLTPVYVPDVTAFDEGGYEVGLWCYSTPETASVIVREAGRLIKSLKALK
jgi:neutral ceramidase